MFLAEHLPVQLELGLDPEFGAVFQLEVLDQILVQSQVNGVLGLVFDQALVSSSLACNQMEITNQ